MAGPPMMAPMTRRPPMPHDPSHEAPTAPLGFERGLTNYGDRDFALYLRRFFLKSMGYSGEILRRPVIGIASSPSGYNNCHRAMPELVEAVKRGVLAAGALPIDFPTISLGESFLTPTSLMFRNLMSMDVEEMVRAQPMDAVVLIGGCDKTVPAQLMGAAAADVPAVQLVTGPMMPGRHEGERLGACTDCRRFWASFRAGTTSSGQIEQIEGRLATTAGTCAVMGTASNAGGRGMPWPGPAMTPAVHADRLRAAEASGAAAVRLAHQPIRPREIITSKSVENAVRVLLALGGSTNAIIHLTAIAGRLGLQVSLQRLNELSESTPVLVNLKPSGAHYMEDFHAAGGMGGLLRELAPLLHLDTLTVTGETLGERLAAEGGTWADPGIVRPLRDPIEPQGGLGGRMGGRGGLGGLYGNLAPAGAILKRSAADKRLFEKEGRVVLFDSLEDLAQRIADPDLDVTADDILVLCNAGPKSASGMPEAGYLPIPKKLAQQGVKDMVRISDARMSGTAFGTIVLHVSPEAAAGGPLALVKNGGRIRLSVEHRSLELLVRDEELRRRHADIVAAPIGAQRGYARLYREHVLQADGGCDFDFLQAVALHAPRDGR